MRAASLILSSVLAICAPVAAQTSAAADASKVFAYDATKPPTPTESVPTTLKLLVCLAKTGVNTPETMFPNWCVPLSLISQRPT